MGAAKNKVMHDLVLLMLCVPVGVVKDPKAAETATILGRLHQVPENEYANSRETTFRAVTNPWATGQTIRKDGAIHYPTSHPKTIRYGKDTPTEQSTHAYDPKTGLTKE
jgi:hypothetical protein